MQIPGFDRVDVAGANCRLSVLVGGSASGEPLVLLHGMRDHAAMFAFLSEYLPDHRLIIPDLRGHGDSDHPGTYSAVEMVADLVAVQRHFGLETLNLAGHSLGGHIVSRFAVFYPEAVNKLVMLDGMGPPFVADPDGQLGLDGRTASWRMTIDQLLESGQSSRTMADREVALARFRKGNPGLSEEGARLFIETGTKAVDGGYRWKFDSGLEMFWTGVSTLEHEQSLPRIRCPVLVVTGEHALDYWTSFLEHLIGQTAFYESELERRLALFADARGVVIPGAGHMLHYDQPALLGDVMRGFLQD